MVVDEVQFASVDFVIHFILQSLDALHNLHFDLLQFLLEQLVVLLHDISALAVIRVEINDIPHLEFLSHLRHQLLKLLHLLLNFHILILTSRLQGLYRCQLSLPFFTQESIKVSRFLNILR